MKVKLNIFFLVLFSLIIFSPKETRAQDNKLRILCKPVAVPVNKNKPNYSNKPIAKNSEVYEITFSSNEKGSISEIKVLEKFNTGVTYQDEEWIKNLFENSLEDILFTLKPISQKFVQANNRVVIRKSKPIIFPGVKKTGYLQGESNMLDLESLNLEITRRFNDDWIYKARCEKVGLEEPPTYAYNLSTISMGAREVLEKVDKNKKKDIFSKYISLNALATKEFNKWEEDNYPNEIPFHFSRFQAISIKAFDQRLPTISFTSDNKNPVYDIDEAYENANIGILMLNTNDLKKKYSGAYLTRAEIGFAKYILSKDKSVSLLKKNVEDIDRYLQSKGSNIDTGKAHYIKGSSLIFINTKSSLTEACQNFKKAEDNGYTIRESLKEICKNR